MTGLTAPVDGPRLSVTALPSFACGFATLFSFDWIGRIYLTELLLLPTAALAFFLSGGHRCIGSRWFWALVISGLLMLGGQVMSDLVRGIIPAFYLRGWAKCGFQVLDVVCICVLLAADRRNLWWYVLGLCLGSLVYLIGVEAAPLSSWKVTYAVPAALLVLCLDAWRPPRWLIPSLLVAVGLTGLLLDARAEPAIVLIVAALHATRRTGSTRPLAWASFARLMSLPLLLGVLAFALLFAATDADYRDRREQSSLARGLSYTIGVPAILASPWIGNGSWNDNRELSNRQFDIMRKALPTARAAGLRYTGFSPHSQILQAWYEGGVLAVLFFVVLLVGLIRALPQVVLWRPRDALSGIMVYLLLSQCWHLFMSPFNGGHRLNIMLACGVVVLLAGERLRAHGWPRGWAAVATAGRPSPPGRGLDTVRQASPRASRGLPRLRP